MCYCPFENFRKVLAIKDVITQAYNQGKEDNIKAVQDYLETTTKTAMMAYYFPDMFKDLDPKTILPEAIGAQAYNDGVRYVLSLIKKD